jgi:hypothetical protein
MIASQKAYVQCLITVYTYLFIQLFIQIYNNCLYKVSTLFIGVERSISRAGGTIFIYSYSALLISFEIDCF